MEDQVRHHLTSPNIWTRFLYMVLFAIAYSIAEFVIICIAIFQFFAALITGRVNEPLLRFGDNLSTYVYQIFRYQTFNSEVRPFPFTDWPDEPQADNDWLKQSEPEVDPVAPASATTPAAAPSEPVPASPSAVSEESEPTSVPEPTSGSEPTGGSEQNVDDSGQSSDDYRIR